MVLPGIQIKKVSPGIKKVKVILKVSIYSMALPIYSQSDQGKATLLSALHALQSISRISLTDENNAEAKCMAEAIAKSLSDYLRFDDEKYFYKFYILNTMAWMLSGSPVAIALLASFSISFVSALYLMMLVPVVAACFGLVTGYISNQVSASRRLKMTYEKLIAAIDRVNKHDRVRKQKLDVIEEVSSVSSLELPNNTDQLKFSQFKQGVFCTAFQLKPSEGSITEAEAKISLRGVAT
ncbi:hypothetical protein RVIR1_05870 [Candidatus Rickettsiella viridis]|uniref:Uncharacterized protein n=1 Tax=Candidatus Rickettsiella viridis TaxID=676208 RepID=A0A2Z5UU78_9COXI|nr:hypothetical protein RVIR1_05870 [Candidatus Rickettsiella viridis]